MPGVSGCLRLASGKWSPVFPRCGPVLFCPVQSCPLMSCPVLSCPMPLSPGMSCLVFFKDVIFVFFQFLLLLFPSFLVVPLSVCLVFFPSVFVFPFCTGSGSNFHFCPRPCFEHLSKAQNKGVHLTCSPTSRAHSTLVSTACVSSPMDWAVSRSSHKQNNDVANYGIGSCTEEPSGRPGETAGHSAPASLPLPFRIDLFFAPCSLWCSHCVPTVPWLCAVSLVLRIFQMITVHTFASSSNAKMFGISATTLYVVWTSAACALMF